MHKIPSAILYHYTSGTGVLGILGSDSLWATKIHFMNDHSEFKHAISIAKSQLNGLREGRTGDSFSQVAAALSEVLDSSAGLGLFVACFSEDYDSLSQWRGYCPRSFGYNVGFNGDLLHSIAREQGFQLRPCEYDVTRQRTKVSEWAHESVTSIEATLASGSDPKVHTQKNCNEAMQKFIQFAPFFKDPSFKDEREWRMVGFIPSYDPRIALRIGISTLVPYIPVRLKSRTDNSPLWDIRAGPTPHPDLAMDALSHFFNVAKIKNGISHSLLPYRDW